MSEYRIDISENILLQDKDFVETKIKINKNIQKIRKNIEERKKKVISEFINKRVEEIQNNRIDNPTKFFIRVYQTVYSSYNKSSQ
jgi:predicted metal-dependent hydrolase